jgi:hypothetical protein
VDWLPQHAVPTIFKDKKQFRKDLGTICSAETSVITSHAARHLDRKSEISHEIKPSVSLERRRRNCVPRIAGVP